MDDGYERYYTREAAASALRQEGKRRERERRERAIDAELQRRRAEAEERARPSGLDPAYERMLKAKPRARKVPRERRKTG